MYLQNVVGTTGLSCKCGTWYRHWQRHSGQTAHRCVVKGCLETDLVGAHVQFIHGFNPNLYIIPICKGHNQQTGLLDVVDDVNPVLAIDGYTCGS